MRHFEKYSSELRELVSIFREEAAGKPFLKVLEAGCGREWHLRPCGVNIELTGVDLDEHALGHRKNVQKDLDEAIIGDLRTVPLPAATFDIVYSSFVLEHIEGAEQALDNMLRSLKRGGLLIVRVPDLQGVQTFFARRLPRWAAIAYYRHAWKISQAGQPGFAPYPTFYDPVISIAGFHEYCRRRGLVVEEQFGVGSYASRGTGLVSRLVPVAARIVHVVSLGRIHGRYVDVTYIARKMVD
ncbi:class I SAM-dependent methyltransferase [Aestuariivirga sp.]|uniref:class I SAM-dependent methyltransferase n=1 Tax=Aestuariivirga sp. TaxID=2650926 RepID=UPI00391995BA